MPGQIAEVDEPVPDESRVPTSTSTSDPQPVQFSFREIGVQLPPYHLDAVSRRNEWRVPRAGASRSISCRLSTLTLVKGRR